jgi:Flp pilus assembly protein CpaB
MPAIAAALPWITAITAVAGAGVAAYSAVEQGNAAEDAAKRTQKAENANAQAAMEAASLEAGQVRRKNLLRLGSQRADAAKSGVLINDSANDVIYDTAIQGELEAQSVLYSGASAASYQQQRGVNARAAGNSAKSASYINAGSSIIGGIGKTAATYSDAMPTFKKTSSRSALYNERGPQ